MERFENIIRIYRKKKKLILNIAKIILKDKIYKNMIEDYQYEKD